MTTDIRSRLAARISAVLDEKTKNLPDSIPIAVPVGPLADAVIDVMTEGSGVPLLPSYDAETWGKRRWTVPFSQEEVINGASVYDIAVKMDPGSDDGAVAPAVVITARASGAGEIAVGLPIDDAEEFLVAGLAAVAAARAARIDEPSERG
jgi:hypothetical protein